MAIGEHVREESQRRAEGRHHRAGRACYGQPSGLHATPTARSSLRRDDAAILLHPLRHHHVVHVHVGRDGPFVGERVVDHAGLFGDGELVVSEMVREFVGGDELVPLMGAARQPAQHVFGADDGERKALPVAVQGRDHHQAAGLEHRRAALEEHADIGDVLDHFHRQHDIEAFAHVHLLDRGAAVVDRQMALLGVQPRRGDIAGGGIDPDHLRAQPGERLAQQPGAAADIEDAQAPQAIQASARCARTCGRRRRGYRSAAAD